MTSQDVMDAARSFASACDAAHLLAKSEEERRRIENLFAVGMEAVMVANKHVLEKITELAVDQLAKEKP